VDNLNIRHYFNTIICALDVVNGKPDPEVYLKCAQKLNVNPTECIVFEDVPKGAEAASRAGMKCVVVTTTHPEEDFKYLENILFFIKDYNDPRLLQLIG